MRRIDADALREQFPEPKDWRDPEQALVHITGIWAEIDNAPTIEPRCEECEAFNRTRLLIPQPERKKGKWIMLDKGLIVTSYECSECGRTVREDTGYDVSKDYPFCHCGADMRGDENDQSK